MTRLSAVIRHGHARLMVHGLTLLLMIFLAACGDGSDSGDIRLASSSSASETGSAVLNLQWHDAATIKGAVDTQAEQPLDCEASGVATITCKVYDESDTLLKTGDAWPCSEHSGAIDEIPVGQNRTFVILAADDEENIVFQGQKTNINIEERQDNDVGTIAVWAFVPEGLTATTHSAAQIDLAWTQPNEDVAPAGYHIYRDGVQVGTSASSAYSDTGLIQSTEYCYTVSAYDIFGNASGPGIEACATTDLSADEDPPTVPRGLAAQAVSASQIDLVWIESSDNVEVAEYRIYRDGNQVGASASTSYSDTGLIQNSRHCYTVEAYDAAGNPSGASEQACVTTLESFDWYRDSDGDNYGDPNDSVVSETQPPGYVSDHTDCNDDASSIHPGAQEACNAIDDNCNGNVDEGLTFDTDGDGYTSIGSCEGPRNDCDDNNGAVHPGAEEVCNSIDDNCDGNTDEDLTFDADNDGYSSMDSCQGSRNDCDDNNGAVNPGAQEACNGSDDDCDGEVDEGVQTTYYRDADTDGYGDANNATQACELPTGYAIYNSDCNDDDATIHPGASEIYDGNDNDCDGLIDEGMQPYYEDADRDGYGNPNQSIMALSQPNGYVSNNLDCNDEIRSVNPDGTEICNGIDDNCDGNIDEGLTFDADGDGYTSMDSCQGTRDDCDDSNGAIHPGMEETCNGIDDNCDGNVDEGLTFDADGDGHTSIGSCQGTRDDCNDSNGDVHPGAEETCNGIDDNCNGEVDEGLTFDADRDGHTSTASCQGSRDDCNDNNGDIHPGAEEVCNGIDDNCNGEVDEGLTFDNDGDGYSSTDSCQGTRNDCNDNNGDVNPGAQELCNNDIDDDCDGEVDEAGCLAECFPELPSPVLEYSGSYLSTGSDGRLYRHYDFGVSNSGNYPDELFTPAPHLPPCGENTNSSRAWVEIYDDEGTYIYGFCALSSSDELEALWFAIPADEAPPESIYIEIIDRECDHTYLSNPLIIEDRHSITNIQLNPESPAELYIDQDVDISFNYFTTEPGGVRIFARPFTNGELTPYYAAHASPLYPTGAGNGSGYFTLTIGPESVDQIRFEMLNADQSELLLEFYLDVSYDFYYEVPY